MATTKTLTPTNQTISIPELSDAPDMSVAADAIDKEADAINALGSNIIKKSATSLGTYNYASEVVTAIKNNILSLLNNGESMLCSFVANADRDYWYNGQTYIGVVSKKDGNAYSGIFTSGKGDSFSCGTDNNASASAATGTKQFALKNQYLKNDQYEPSFTIRANQSGAIIVGKISTITGGVVDSSNFKNVAINFPGIALVPLTDSNVTNLYVYVIAAPTSDITKTLQVTFFYS